MTLAELLEASAGDLTGTTASTGPDGATTWSRGGRVFAALSADGSVASFCLDPVVASAAGRTPDVRPSDRGSGWVDFAPTELDGHASDRAVAWLASAHRRSGLRD
jgi:hypothetical protein